MTSDKKLFISHSHKDHDFAERLARELMSQGQDVWLDKWEIQPGDSIVSKIFEEGLSNAAAFAIVLSKESVRSKWVRDELNIATIRRIEDLTRVIPLLKEDVEIPTALRTLHWIDMRSDFARGVRAIYNVLHGISEKPSLGETPAHLQSLIKPVAGLSRIASSVGLYLLNASDVDEPFIRGIRNKELSESLSLAPVEVNDAVDELESQGLAETDNELGTHPFVFGFVTATYLLFHALSDFLSYSPQDDVRVVLSAVAALEKTDGTVLQSHTHLSPGRLNRAVDYIKDYGYADVLFALGTAPYRFSEVKATRITRQESLD
ncbi:MAG: toll/interleukin-1 receptor domain-containing protein [Chlorobium sp.]|uniref:toll/interleukin-1 receptor domain-containing protein n=1 Tax=Chlorobium sp. TaxID=1095 RepID=UPI002F42CDED